MAAWIYGLLWGSIATISMVNGDGKNNINVDHDLCIVTLQKYFVIVLFVMVFFIPVFAMGYIYTKVLMIARRHALAIRAVSKSFLNESPIVSSQLPHHRHSNFSHNIPIGENRLRVPPSSGYQSPLLSSRHKVGRSPSPVNNGHSPRSRNSSASSNHRTPMQEYRKTILKASKTVVVVYGTFVVAWAPVCVISLILSVCKHCVATNNSSQWHYNIFIEVFPFLSSMLNPFIYGVMNRQYRRAFRSILESYHLLKPKHSPVLPPKDYITASPYASSVL